MCDYPLCYNKFCGFDWNECPDECECALDFVYNGECNLACNVKECDFDNRSCPIDGCTICDQELLNDECDLKCNTE